MSRPLCAHDQHVAEAARSGRWPESLTAHLADCPECADTALVSGLMCATEDARELEVDLSLAERIWWRAEMEKRSRSANRALMPIKIAEVAACVLGGAWLVAIAAPHALALSSEVERASGSIFSNPIVAVLGTVFGLLLAGAGLASAILIYGAGLEQTRATK